MAEPRKGETLHDLWKNIGKQKYEIEWLINHNKKYTLSSRVKENRGLHSKY